jgi:hypothetical protein
LLSSANGSFAKGSVFYFGTKLAKGSLV